MENVKMRDGREAKVKMEEDERRESKTAALEIIDKAGEKSEQFLKGLLDLSLEAAREKIVASVNELGFADLLIVFDSIAMIEACNEATDTDEE